MDRHPSGLDDEIIAIRESNKKRILKIFIQKIEKGKITSDRYKFEPGLSHREKYNLALGWWNSEHFHLKFAIRTPELLNKMLAYSLDNKTIDLMEKAKRKGIPFFVNPYYLSLVNIDAPDFAIGADQAIRDYIFCSEELIEEFGDIVAWEKEDLVEPDKPNAAGWMLPNTHNIHRRYPEVAILIPDTVGRACGGLCVSCQRMYDFQNGHLNFNLDKLQPRESWHHKLIRLLNYFEDDSQLRDILITGGDSLMSSNKSIKLILDEVYEMALRKINKNNDLPDGKKHAEMLRIRLGTRLPVYIPQRVNDELIEILAEFKEKASKIGFKQFVIQTHFVSTMEVTPEVKIAVEKILNAGWFIANQQVFIAAASKRGHTAKLRKVLNDIGVMTYYTFSVKGFQENRHNFSTNARAIQEQREEKIIGEIPDKFHDEIATFPLNAERMVKNISELRKLTDLPFLGTDRNVMNMPGVGKSLTFRTIGITNDGRRILKFDQDQTRKHSPTADEMGKIFIVESKSIANYLNQMENMGEDMMEYKSLYGYSMGSTEPRDPIYSYPDYDFEITKELTNFEITHQSEV
jgi:lysine 2,3-aminomutase